MIDKPKIVIASIARNIGDTFSKDYDRVLKAFSEFTIIRWIIVESNSTDNSIKLLKTYSKLSTKILYVSLQPDKVIRNTRTIDLAAARNKYLELFGEIRKETEVDYLVVCDLNNLNNKLNKEAVQSCWAQNDWAAVLANQNGPYYDVWALRHKFWNDFDCWERYENLLKIYRKPSLALWDAVYSRMVKIPKNWNWIKVDSGFGGIGIYRTAYLDNCKYVGTNTNGKQVCEHVSFNSGIIDNGGSIYINPKFINFNLTDHSRRKKYFRFYNVKYLVIQKIRVRIKK